MARVLLVLLLAFLLALPVPAADLGRSGATAWEAADDTVAYAVLEDGGAAAPFDRVDVLATVAIAAPPVESSAPRAASVPPAPGRAPPAC